jgi:hypothetical protein
VQGARLKGYRFQRACGRFFFAPTSRRQPTKSSSCCARGEYLPTCDSTLTRASIYRAVKLRFGAAALPARQPRKGSNTEHPSQVVPGWDKAPPLHYLPPLAQRLLRMSSVGFLDDGLAMTDARDRSPYAGVALVLALIFGLVFWAGVAYAVIPKNWLVWPKVAGCIAPPGPECARRSSKWC